MAVRHLLPLSNQIVKASLHNKRFKSDAVRIRWKTCGQEINSVTSIKNQNLIPLTPGRYGLKDMKMKNLILLIVFIFVSLSGEAQEHNEDLVLFSKATAIYDLIYEEFDLEYEIELLDSAQFEDKVTKDLLTSLQENLLVIALEYFEQIIEDYPDSDLIFRSLNNAANISYQLDHIDEAILYYKRIIDSEANDLESNGLGTGIMSEPYALYKNRATKKLAEICISQEEFSKALEYLKLTKKYPFVNYGGNELTANHLNMSLMYTQAYNGLDSLELAISYSLPEIFNEYLANNEKLVQEIVEILLANYDRQQLISDFEQSTKDFHSEIKEYENYEIRSYFINFMNTKINVPILERSKSELSDAQIIDRMENSYFMKLLKLQQSP